MSQNNLPTFLSLGDSYTIGEMVPTEARWGNQLSQLVPIQKPLIIANTGWTTTELLQALKMLDLQGQFDIVSLLIGVNNQYRNYDINVYKSEFLSLLNYAKARCKAAHRGVLVVSIPDWGYTPFGIKDARGKLQISADIELYNNVAKNICLENDIEFINITPISQSESLDLLAIDALHPNEIQYKLWAEKIAKANIFN